MLVQSEADLETALSQQVTIRTSYEPFAPPTASGSQTANSVVIRIDSYDTMKVWKPCTEIISDIWSTKKF